MFLPTTKFPLAVGDLSALASETDVFFVDPFGTFRMIRVEADGPWSPAFQLGRPGLFPPGAALASWFRPENVQLFIFVVDETGALNASWRWVDVGDPGMFTGRMPISPAHRFPPAAPLAVSPQFGIGQQMDVFLVDKEGALNVAWFAGGGDWNAPIAISAPGVFPQRAAVAASNQFGIPDQTDVFAIDADGALNVAWVEADGPWNGPIRISPTGLFPPGAPVVASNEFGIPDQTDVFAVDNDGALNIAWVVGAGAWHWPVRISLPGVFPPGAHLAVSNQFGLPNQTDVFAVGYNGALQVCWIVHNDIWNGPVQIGPSSLFRPGAPLAASNQAGIPNQTDVLAIDDNRALQVAWVVGSDAWNGPIQIAPALFPVITLQVVETSGRFVEVSGIRFTPNATVSIAYDFRIGSDQQISQDVVGSDENGGFVHLIPVSFSGNLDWIAATATDLTSGAVGNESIYYRD